MKALYGTLVGVMAMLIVSPLAVAGPPSWDDQIKRPNRFNVLTEFGSAAVLDRETGLVWERSPDTTVYEWLGAQPTCNIRNVGGRKGWRLPGIQELATLVDPSAPSGGPSLPAGHPFINVRSSFYWSSTSSAGASMDAFGVQFFDGAVGYQDKTFAGVDGDISASHIWCVRGGQGIDPQ